MTDMDQPPVDHGSDRYDYIEIDSSSLDYPKPKWLTPDWTPCQDCRANAFLRWVDGDWKVTVAPMAPVRAARERGVEPQLVTGYDPAGGGLVVAWRIPDTNQFVVEGYIVEPPDA